MEYMKNEQFSLKIFFVLFFIFINQTFSQDTIYIYDVASQSLTHKLMPAFNTNSVSGYTNPSFGVRGVTAMPAIAPVDTYPNTQISLLKKASEFYTDFNFPFTAVTNIRYGLSITTAVIGRRALLAFKYDVYDPGVHAFRNLHDCNPYFENGTIQYGSGQLHPVRYYLLNSPSETNLYKYFAVIEVEENIGDSSGYFGLAFDTTMHAYDSLLLYNISYPATGYPVRYSFPVNGDTLCMKYGLISNPDSYVFKAYWGDNGEFCSPYFDDQFRIHGLRWGNTSNYKIGRNSFYFLKYVTDSLATGISEVEQSNGFSIYPNPAIENITVHFSGPQKSAGMLYIQSIDGRIVRKNEIMIGEIKTDISVKDLAAGIYLVTVGTDKGNSTRKFIKQ